jgi:hypothetical protein
LQIVVWLVVCAILATIVYWLLNKAIPEWSELWRDDPGGASLPPYQSTALNCKFAHPGKSWKTEESAKCFGYPSLLGMRRTEPNAWLTLAAKDYKTTMPRDAELFDEAIRRLTDYFQHLEWNQKPDDKLAEQRAQHFTFQGVINHVVMQGDCYMFGYKGIGYWLVTWAPAESAATSKEEFDELRKGLTLLKEREGWTIQRPPVRVFRGEQASYSLKDSEGLWEPWSKPKDMDPAGDILLEAKDKVEAQAVDRSARLLVMVLPKENSLADAVKAARKHLEEQHRGNYPATTMEVIRDQEGPQDRDGLVGEVGGHVVKLHVKNTQARERLVVLAVVSLPQQIVAIQCECDWKRRSLWEADFAQILGTFSLKVD